MVERFFLVSIWTVLALVAQMCSAGLVTLDNGTSYRSRGSLIGPRISVSEPFSGELIAAGQVPFQVPNGTLGCNSFVSNQFNNSIALIERGECDFQNKIYHAQLARAIGVIVFDKEFNSFLSTMTGTESSEIFKKIKIPSFFVSRESGLDLTDAYLNIFTLTSNGLPVEITVIPNEYDSDADGFYFSDYRTLGIVFGVFMGGSVFFWIGFCVWRKHQMSLRALALKKLRRIKYSPQAVNEHLAQMPVNSPPESSSSPTTSNESVMMASRPAKSSEASEKVEFSPTDDANSNVKLDGDNEEEQTRRIQEVSVNESNNTNNNNAVVDIEQGIMKNASSPSVASNKAKSGISSPFKKIWGRRKGGKSEANSALFDSGNCSVCLEEFQRDEDVLVLPCRHIFHPDCVTEWITSRGQCPVCKANVINCQQRPGDEFPKTGLGRLFGNSLVQTLVSWLVALCLAVMLGYFLAATGLFKGEGE